MYLRERPHDVPDQETFLWWIPIILVKETDLTFYNSTPLLWMKKQRQIQLKNMPDSTHFIIVNPEEIGNFNSKKSYFSLTIIICRSISGKLRCEKLEHVSAIS